MMTRSRRFVRTLLALLLVGACFAAMLFPLLEPARAANSSAITSEPPGDLVISQFRFGTASNQGNEFIELFNRSCSNDIVLTGWSLHSSDGAGNFSTIDTSPAFSTLTIKKGSYLLIANNAVASSLGVAPDATYTIGIPRATGGVAVYNNAGAVVDQVGLDSSGFFEGSPISLTGPYPAGNLSFFRKTVTGLYIDTNSNLTDFTGLKASNPHNASSTGTCGTPAPTSTPKATNTAFVFNPQVMINEVAWYGTIYNTNSDWIELYNTTAQDIDLTGWMLEALDGVPSIHLTGVIKAHGYYLLANDGSSVDATSTPSSPGSTCRVFQTSDHVRIDQYFTGDVAYYNEVLFLTGPNGATVDTANRNGGYWPAGSYTNHASMERHGIVPDSDTAWYTYAQTSTANIVHDCGPNGGNRVYGSPGRANWAATVTATPSPVPTTYKTATPRPPTPFGHMVINEFLPRAGYDYNQDGTVDVYDEFVEIKNLGPVAANLAGWKLDVISPGGPSSYALSGTLQPDQRMLFYSAKSHLSLYDSGGTVRLISNRNIVIDARSYGPVQSPDQSICRIPDGFYWRFPCFPTPGLENSLTGTLPVPPPVIAAQPPPCLLADTVPEPFKQAECYGYGQDVYNPAYWDDQSGFNNFPVPDVIDKNGSDVQ